MADEYDYLFKCIVVGDGGVGKTALTIRFSKGFFTEDYKMTIGVDFHVKTISIDTEEEGPIKVKLQIWDTGGQERFSSIRPMYYRGSLGGLLIFDLTSYESFEHLPQWIEEVRANIKTEIPLLLVGNKSDLVNERSLSTEEINKFTQKFNLYYMETSAKTGEGVGDCFYILACLMVGSGIPDQLISQGIVYSPGNIITAPSIAPSEPTSGIKPELNVTSPALEPKTEPQFIASPVPEPAKTIEPEPEIEFAAPPVPEPAKTIESEPEIEFAAPPVPEPAETIEQEPETEFAVPPVPEPVSSTTESSVKGSEEFEFKTPDQILSEEVQEEEPKPPFSIKSEISASSEPTAYKPKAIPFTSNIPVPAPGPEGFKKSEPVSELLVDYMPETIISKKERKKLEKQKKKEEKEKRLKKKREKAAKLKEEMQKVGKEEKEKAKSEKEKVKLEKEKKLQEKKEKAAKLKEEMQKVGKKEKLTGLQAEPQPFIPFQTTPQEKKETFVPFQAAQPDEKKSDASTLFQTLSQKSEQAEPAESAPFIPFGDKTTSEKQESSGLRIIPNVADFDKEKAPSSPPLPEIFDTKSEPAIPKTPDTSDTQSKRKDIVICQYCGAMLSSDYAFCNKCGAKL